MEHWTGSQEDVGSFIHSCMFVVCNRLQSVNLLKESGPSCQAAMVNVQGHNQVLTVPCIRNSDKEKDIMAYEGKNVGLLLR